MISAEQRKIHADYRKERNIEHSRFIGDLIASYGFVQPAYNDTAFHLNHTAMADEHSAQLGQWKKHMEMEVPHAVYDWDKSVFWRKWALYPTDAEHESLARLRSAMKQLAGMEHAVVSQWLALYKPYSWGCENCPNETCMTPGEIIGTLQAIFDGIMSQAAAELASFKAQFPHTFCIEGNKVASKGRTKSGVNRETLGWLKVNIVKGGWGSFRESICAQRRYIGFQKETDAVLFRVFCM